MASPEEPADPDGPPRAVMVAAIVVALAAVVGILVVAAIHVKTPEQRPVAIVAIPAPQADGDACRALLDALPARLGDYDRAAVAQPAPAGAAAWQPNADGDPVILRCGLDRPTDFVAGTPVQMVDDVAWFHIADTGRTTWITVDRPVYVALTLPDGSGPTPIQSISAAVAKAMPAVAVNPGPAR
ncbi:MAG: hypothetical protein JWQ86_4843 [Mycobacterium sp.]|nr:hypothetical protein [Mycobacterium sp.]